jgi:CYTH domain-containing protein
LLAGVDRYTMPPDIRENDCMATEIERKFLVVGKDWRAAPGIEISQGYLNRDKERTVRVRVEGERAALAIKGITRGATRAEFEYEIPRGDAEQLLALCERPLVRKVRYRIPHQGLVWEVDEFLDENQGLVVAEVELQRESQAFAKPHWVGAEITDDPRYYNANLSTNPFKTWAK